MQPETQSCAPRFGKSLRISVEGTACGEYDSRTLRLAAADSSAKGLSSRRPVPNSGTPLEDLRNTSGKIHVPHNQLEINQLQEVRAAKREHTLLIFY